MADLCSRRPADHRTSWSASRRRSAAITILSCRLLSGSRTTEIVIAGVRGNSRPSRRDWSATQAAGIAVNALWPRTVIATAAVQNLLGGDAVIRQSRKPGIMADAAYAVFNKPAREFSGKFLIDDNFLADNGVTDFEQYRVDAAQKLAQDFFVPENIAPPKGVTIEAGFH